MSTNADQQRALGAEEAAGTKLEGLPDVVFESHPFGMVVTNASGRLLARNPAASNVLGPATPEPRTCCRIFGCGEGVLEGICLSRYAAGRSEPLPEMRLDIERADGTTAAWVTSVGVRGRPDLVLIQLRPGTRGDRRRRTEPHWTSGPRLRIVTLGRTRVESNEVPISGSWLDERPGKVLKLLATERNRVVHVDEVAEAIWPDADHRTAANVRHAIHVLRKKLHPARDAYADPPFVLSRRGGYTLNAALVSVDADEFERLARNGIAALAEDDVARAADDLERALALYGGDFISDEPYSDWCVRERERLRDLASRALQALADVKLRIGDEAGAGKALEALADMHPFDSDVNRAAIAHALRRGRRTVAMRRYTVLRKRLLSEFGHEPDFALHDLVAR